MFASELSVGQAKISAQGWQLWTNEKGGHLELQRVCTQLEFRRKVPQSGIDEERLATAMCGEVCAVTDTVSRKVLRR